MEQQNHSWSASILYGLAWLICSILVIVDILAIREASLDILTAVQYSQLEAAEETEKGALRIQTGFTLQTIDQGFMFIGGIVAVTLAIAIEYYFRLGQQKGHLLRRVGIVVGWLVGIFIVCVVIQTFV
jgi:hypothetical protein